MENKLIYKDYPLARCGNRIYYGNMTDKFIILLEIKATRKAGDVDIPAGVHIELRYTDPEIQGKNKIVKTADRETMSDALELAAVWLGKNNKQ